MERTRRNFSPEQKVNIKEHRRPQVLAGIVHRAKTVLEADPRFFEGASALAGIHTEGCFSQ